MLKYLKFGGRAARLTYWLFGILQWFVLFATVFLVSQLFGTNLDEHGFAKLEDITSIGQIVAAVVFVTIVWVGICVEVQRWHDRGKSGWWFWLALVPVIGEIWTLIECGFRRGTIGPNSYGPDPLARG